MVSSGAVFPIRPMALVSYGARGTDILYEDAETLAKDRWNQMRLGLPGLERRVMYRSAALALWGKVDGHGSITGTSVDFHDNPHDDVGGRAKHVSPADFSRPLENVANDADPNKIRLGALPIDRNPLLKIIPRRQTLVIFTPLKYMP